MSSKGESLGGGPAPTAGKATGSRQGSPGVVRSLLLTVTFGAETWKGGRLTTRGPAKAALEKELRMVVGIHGDTVLSSFEVWKVPSAGWGGTG